ncbi:adenosine receptor A1-like [Oculina patagonica]
MNPSNTDLATNASSHVVQVLSEFFCPFEPVHIWVLSERTAFKIAAAITLMICPVAIFLNILVILAIKLNRELKEHNSNILLASLAVADVLIGAVSMPLAICLDVFILLKRYMTPGILCRIAFVNALTLYIGGCSSTYHLAVIAWERYVAITKSTEYKVIVTRGRVKKYAKSAWLLCLFITIPPRIMKLAGVQYKYLVVINMVATLPAVVCIILVGYFYLRVYLCVCKRNINSFSEVRSLIKAKLTTKVAKTTAMLTAAVLISFIPSSVYVLFGEANPALRRSSYFRWSMIMVHLNSVINPVLYCYRDRRYRNAMLEMITTKKTTAGAKKIVRRIGSAQSVEDVPEINSTPRSRIRSCGSITNLEDTHQWRTHGEVKRGRRTSAPSDKTNRMICVDIHQPKMIATKPVIQVKSDVTRKGTRSHHEDTSDKSLA